MRLIETKVVCVDDLTPCQQQAADCLIHAASVTGVLVLRGDAGMGKTTILRRVQAALGGGFVTAGHFVNILTVRDPAAIEESFFEAVQEKLEIHDVVIVDDLHLLVNVTQSCDYPRGRLLDAFLAVLLAEASSRGKKLIFGMEGDYAPDAVRQRAHVSKLGELTAADYEAIGHACLSEKASSALDYSKIHRAVPYLNGHQIKTACLWLAKEKHQTTNAFLDYLTSQNMESNVELEEVAPVTWDALKGMNDVIRTLEAKIALPFENDGLAADFQLKPKRGVLLAGPPGTGKTTIGRALAHRLKSKFFLIDGTVVAGTGNFYDKVNDIFEAARRNAPAVIFIDDADVIFEHKGERGFYRYLLTKLDGLKSASAERICVMMTAMDVSRLPAALVRSGRIELWLETRLPDEEARLSIIGERVAGLPDPIGTMDIHRLAVASRGLTGADLKGVIEDGKLLYAHDKADCQSTRPIEEYFLEAIGTVRANRRNYARAKPARLMDGVTMGFHR
jgi:ATP-dependent 26S proteasome regulatory subunit